MQGEIAANQERAFDEIESEFDVIVAGGGIVGTGIARDAAMRGLDVLLLEKDDFCSGTTSGSTRLIHGGIRYLEMFDFGLVFEGLQERKTLRKIAPHLVTPLRFLIPSYNNSHWERIRRRIGMYLYDLLSYNKELPSHSVLPAEKVEEEEPGLRQDGLQETFTYYDCQVSFVERLCIENLVSAVKHGATVFNHAAVDDLVTDSGTVEGVTVEDAITGEKATFEGRIVVNATGPWAHHFDSLDEDFIRPTKGIHLVLPDMTDNALVLPTTDGRIIFVVPWNGMSLVGTTDTDFQDDPATAAADRDDVDYLLDELQRYFPDVEEDDIIYTYAAVRPLYDSGKGGSESDVSREHKIIEDAGGKEGLVTVAGAKITAYRAAAEEAVDTVEARLGRRSQCRTDTLQLPGAVGDGSHQTDRDSDKLRHLYSLYGSRAEKIIEIGHMEPELQKRLCEHTMDVMAQIVFAVQNEFALTLPDVMLRRLTVGYAECQGRCCVENVGEKMQELLDWSDERREQEIEQYRGTIQSRKEYSK